MLAKIVRMEWFDTGVECLSLSSSPPSSEEGHITACPHTTVTLTCTATQVGSMTWRDQDLIHTFLPGDIESEQTRVVHDDPYTLTLTTVENIMGALADLTSTLEVMVDDIDNGTDITCAVFQNQDHLLIYTASGFMFGKKNTTSVRVYIFSHTGSPSQPSNIMALANDYQRYNFSIIISWEAPEYGLVDEYRVEINTTTQTFSTNTTSLVLEGEYNIPLEINISATNCAGSSAEVTEEVHVGMSSMLAFPLTSLTLPPSASPSQLAVLLPLHLSMAVYVL